MYPKPHRKWSQSFPSPSPKASCFNLSRSRRLDFSYFEFNMPSFEAVLEGCWGFHKTFKAQHGFGPRGYAIYFVKRGYTPDAPSTKPSKGGSSGRAAEAEAAAAADSESESEGVLTKPYGNYSNWGPGVSFMMDPITDDADSPLVRGCEG